VKRTGERVLNPLVKREMLNASKIKATKDKTIIL
jgi:hypothetical protein